VDKLPHVLMEISLETGKALGPTIPRALRRRANRVIG
jgi:hypothetical protein